jgi:hypothetical protein
MPLHRLPIASCYHSTPAAKRVKNSVDNNGCSSGFAHFMLAFTFQIVDNRYEARKHCSLMKSLTAGAYPTCARIEF